METLGRVLAIAGSDSGGGAGIQADIKAITALGGYAMTAVTAITVQNTKGVTGIHPVPAEVIGAQIRSVLGDIGADTVKTGMLGSAEIVQTVAAALADAGPDIPLILDPVMIATSGDRLVDDDAVAAIRDQLLPRAAIVTPNSPEAETLTGRAVTNCDEQVEAGRALVAMGAGAALIKGGHLSGPTVRDVLVTAKEVFVFESKRLDTTNTHGTGCTLASAIATGLARGQSLPDAVEAAGRYLHEAILRAPGLGSGHGPVDHGWVLRLHAAEPGSGL
tara:strand:- start:965 stop:1792 length:828 start_codon:yes stop_codon:yes gene_type:complete